MVVSMLCTRAEVVVLCLLVSLYWNRKANGEKVEYESFLMSSYGNCCGLDGERTWWHSCVHSHFVAQDVECVRWLGVIGGDASDMFFISLL